jgi:hypothetical protein
MYIMDAEFENKIHIPGQQMMIIGLRVRDHCGGGFL